MSTLQFKGGGSFTGELTVEQRRALRQLDRESTKPANADDYDTAAIVVGLVSVGAGSSLAAAPLSDLHLSMMRVQRELRARAAAMRTVKSKKRKRRRRVVKNLVFRSKRKRKPRS